MANNQSAFVFIIMSAVAILIGLAFYQGSFSQNVGTLTKTQDAINQSFTFPANGATAELTICGQKVLTNTITNQTSGAIVPTSNYTITQSIGSDGYLAAKLNTTFSGYAGRATNVTCNFQPKGYVDDGATRGIINLIAIFMVLLIIVCAVPQTREGFMSFFNS